MNQSIFKVENRYLYTQTNRDFGLIFLSAHNRSVDLLLNQITNQENVTAIFKPIKIKDNGITKQLAFINCSCLKLEISERGESNAEILFAPYDENNKYTMKPKYYYLSV